MNEDAQSALLKTLEEPPAGVTIILCADAGGASPADGPIALLPGPARTRRALATSRRSSPTTAWPIRRPPPGSAGSPVAGRVSRWPMPERRTRSSSGPS